MPTSRRVVVTTAVAACAALAACSAAPQPPSGKKVDAAAIVAGLGSPSADSPSPEGAAAPTGSAPTGGSAGAASAQAGSTGGPGATVTPRAGSGGASSPAAAGRTTSAGKSTKAAASPTKKAASSTAAKLGYTPLYTGAADTRGITADTIKLCAHAALTYGAAFNTNASDFNVFWTALKDKGGIYGRNVTEDYQNDNYDPATAVQAATTCQGENPFMILGGIGFDQIPGVREWAEQNKELYLYHIATTDGEAGKKYSFTALPSVEQMGVEFELLAKSRYSGKKIGIIHRDSVYWDPGYKAFLQLAKADHLNIVADEPVQNQQANYTQQVLDLKNHGAEVVWTWENALATTEIIQQAKNQVYNPIFMVFPFNLTSQTLGANALNPPMIGIAAWPAFSKGDYTGGFAPYADDIKEFEAEYAKYDPSADLSGLGGDLLFLNWIAQKGVAQLFKDCGKNCTRSSFAHLLEAGYTYHDPDGCGVDFSKGDHHLGSNQVSLFETYQAADNKVNWRPTELCVTQVH